MQSKRLRMFRTIDDVARRIMRRGFMPLASFSRTAENERAEARR
jgi:hypothetical protein